MSEENLNNIESNCGASEAFALQVTDNSMEPEFNKDCIVIIDPVGQCVDGQYIFIEYEGVRWFRKFVKEGDKKYLIALKFEITLIVLATWLGMSKIFVSKKIGSLNFSNSLTPSNPIVL